MQEKKPKLNTRIRRLFGLNPNPGVIPNDERPLKRGKVNGNQPRPYDPTKSPPRKDGDLPRPLPPREINENNLANTSALSNPNFNPNPGMPRPIGALTKAELEKIEAGKQKQIDEEAKKEFEDAVGKIMFKGITLIAVALGFFPSPERVNQRKQTNPSTVSIPVTEKISLKLVSKNIQKHLNDLGVLNSKPRAEDVSKIVDRLVREEESKNELRLLWIYIIQNEKNLPGLTEAIDNIYNTLYIPILFKPSREKTTKSLEKKATNAETDTHMLENGLNSLKPKTINILQENIKKILNILAVHFENEAMLNNPTEGSKETSPKFLSILIKILSK